MMYLQAALGFVLLLGGAEFLVRGAVAVAHRMGLSTLMIGMTVVAFGTSAPELVVSLDATLAGVPDLAIGNIVGSNIANLLLIIGLAGLLFPIAPQTRPPVHDAVVLILASAACAGLIWFEIIGPLAGAVALVGFVAFVVGCYWRETRGTGDMAATIRAREAEELESVPTSGAVAWAILLAGLLAVLLGSDVLVRGGVAIAQAAGVSEAVIGLTLIAVGTSLPELAASVMAAVRGHSDIAVGNVVGSNIFNILCVGGAVAVVGPLGVEPQIRGFDIWVMLAATAMFLPFLLGRFRFGRAMGILFLLLYAAYIGIQVVRPAGVLGILG